MRIGGTKPDKAVSAQPNRDSATQGSHDRGPQGDSARHGAAVLLTNFAKTGRGGSVGGVGAGLVAVMSRDATPYADSSFLTEKQVSDCLSKSRATLRRWRRSHTGPPWGKLGSTVVYSEDGLASWLLGITNGEAQEENQSSRNVNSAEGRRSALGLSLQTERKGVQRDDRFRGRRIDPARRGCGNAGAQGTG